VLIIRLAKIFCVAAIGFDVALVAFDNLTDYWTNFKFVTEVLDMDEVPAVSRIHWRAVTSPILHHASYILIIATEVAGASLCVAGAVAMARQAGQSAALSSREEQGDRRIDARVCPL
jgi:predicted small integral membrane protein